MLPMRLGVTCALVMLLAAGCGGGGSNTAQFHDAAANFTFSYPKSLIQGFTTVTREIAGRAPVYTTNVGTDQTNVVVVSEYPLRRPYEAYTPAAFQPFVDSVVRGIARAVGQRVTAVSSVMLGPLHGYGYELVTPDGSLHTRMVLGFKGRREWFLRCQWNTHGEAVIPAACEQVRTTFALTR
jgi:hypothetical protein